MKLLTVFIVFATLLGPRASSQEISAMSYNIRYDNPADSVNGWALRKDYLISQLRYHRPHILGTQEGLLHQLEDIQKALPEYNYVGVAREDGKEKGEYTAIFFDQNHFELLGNDTFWLSENPAIPSRGWDAALPRICTYALLNMKSTGRHILVFNTHFDHIGEQARVESVQLILRKISEINKENYPVLLLGDLNLEPSHRAILSLSSDMSDSFELAGDKAHGPEGTFNGFDISSPPSRRIDYIFSSRGDFRLLRYAALSDSDEARFPSDHFPVYVEYELK